MIPGDGPPRIGHSVGDGGGTAVEGWVHRRLSECAGQRTEKVSPTTVDTRPYVALEHLAQGRPALLGWSSAGSATSAKTVFFAGDVLFGKLRPNLKKAATARFDGVCSTDILPLFGKDGLDSAFLLQLAHWERFQSTPSLRPLGRRCREHRGSSSGRLRFCAPPPSEQRKIRAVLSSVDDAIEKTQAAVEQAQVVKRSLMQGLFTHDLRGRHREWQIMTLGDFVDVRLSGVDKKITPGEQRVRLCNYTDVYKRDSIRSDVDYMEATATQREIDKCRLEVGDVVITKDSETPDDIGVPAVVREDVPDLVCGYHLAILRPSKSVLDGGYLHCVLGASECKQQFRTYANGITRFGLRRQDIERIRLPVPPISEQRSTVAIIFSMDAIIEKSRSAICGMRIVKRGLLSALLSGEVRVTTDTEAA